MPVAEFMALCLYDPEHGYYNRRAPFGAAGDFVTAPEISQMFGELVGAVGGDRVARHRANPNPVQLIELGPGRGTMMAMRCAPPRTVPEFRKALRVHLIETSPDLQMRQRQTLGGVDDVVLRWHGTLDGGAAGPAIILANEFFDALPIHQAERRRAAGTSAPSPSMPAGELALTVAGEPLAGFEAACRGRSRGRGR